MLLSIDNKSTELLLKTLFNFKGPKLEGGKMTDYVATRWYRSP